MTIEEHQQAENQEVAAPKTGAGTTRVIAVLAVVFAVGMAAIVYSGILSRTASAAALVRETHEDSVLAVSVVHPKTGDAEEEVVLPGSTQAFTDSPIYARTTGYLKKWYVDIGMH